MADDDGRGWEEEEIGGSLCGCAQGERERGSGGLVDAGRDRVPPPVVVAWLELGSLPKPNPHERPLKLNPRKTIS